LISVLHGDLKLPSREHQLASIEHESKFKEKNILFDTARSSTVGARIHSYMDQMSEDLGITKTRKGNFLLDFMMAWNAEDFKDFRNLWNQRFKQSQ